MGGRLWDSSAWLPQDSIVGRLLHTLIGYTDRPTELTRLRISVVAPPVLTGQFVADTMAEAIAIWKPVGVAIEWHRVAAAHDEPRSELTVTMDDAARQLPDGSATLGWIRFRAPDAPEPHIHLSRTNAQALIARTAGLHDKPAILQETLLARALGRSLAHEIGHYLLKSRNHAPRGLMKSIRPSLDFFAPDRTGFGLTPDERCALVALLSCADEEAVR